MVTLIPDAECNADADRAAGAISHLSLHTETTALTGAAEASGGVPEYSRMPVTFNVAGAVGPLGEGLQPATVGTAWSSEVTFDVAAGSYTNYGAWSDLVAGIFRRGSTLSIPQSPTTQDQIKLSIGVGPYSGA